MDRLDNKQDKTLSPSMFYNKQDIDYSLYLVTDRGLLAGRALKDCISAAVRGGATILQLREKEMSTLDFYNEALEIKELLASKNVPLIINDRLDIAMAVNAAGLHIGQEDMPAKVARRLVGPDMLLGVSVYTSEEAKKAEREGADYLGVGTMFPTSTKSDAVPVTIEELKNIKASVSIPVVAIGGINLSNAKALLETDIDGLSIISSILGKEDIYSAAKEFSKLIKSYR